MAEEVEEEVQEKPVEDEAEALERLLLEEGAPPPEVEADPGAPLKNKKLLFAGIGVFLLLAGGGTYWFLSSGEVEETVEEEAPVVEEEEVKPEVEKEIPNIYTLEPFFLPLKADGKETGQFINVRINLLLSNKKLDAEVENVLPLMRQTIYQILERKRPQDFDNPKKPIDERLKREIVTSTNSLLVSGSGKIEDVFFTELVVR